MYGQLRLDLEPARKNGKDFTNARENTRTARVIAANPKNIDARFLMALLNEGSGDHKGAIESYRAVLGIDSSNLFALNNLAYGLATEKPQEALRFGQRAAEIAPDNPTVEDTLGWVYFRMGLYNSALGYLKSAYAKQPTPGHQYHLAMCYLKSGNREQGTKNLSAAVQKDPTLGKDSRDSVDGAR